MTTSHKEEEERVKDFNRTHYEKNRGRWSLDNPGNRQSYLERNRVSQELVASWRQEEFSSLQILDVGCGSGHELARWIELGVPAHNLHGIDVSADRFREVGDIYPDIDFKVSGGTDLPFDDASLDLCVCFTLFSSVLDKLVRRKIADEIVRVLKPGGAVLVYDYRVKRPGNTGTAATSVKELSSYFPDNFLVESKSVTVFPPLARLLGVFAPYLYPLLARVPWIKTHFVMLIKKTSK